MKKTIAILAALVMALTAVAGCSANNNDNGGGTGSTTPTGAPNNGGDNSGNEGNNGGEGETSDFASWTDVDMVNYMKAEGVFVHDDWLYTQTEGIEAPNGITKLISYIDDYGDADIMIFWLQTNAPTERTEEIYEEIKTTHNYIMTEAGNVPCPINAMYGRFAILYSFSLDPDLVAKCEAALEKLTAEYGVQPDFYEKELEMPDYDDYYDDDYFDDYDE